MADDMKTFSITEARRAALTAQGFTMPRGTEQPRGINDLERVFSRIKIVQIDPINVLVRAQYMPFFSRLGAYPRELLDELAYVKRGLYEHFAHVASYLPMQHLPLMRHRMVSWKPNPHWRKMMAEHAGIEEKIMNDIRTRGPLSVSDLEYSGKRYGRWGFSVGKLVLEAKLMAGELAVSDRVNGARRYDSIHRVAPKALLDEPLTPRDDARRVMFKLATDALGIGTVADIADYYRIKRSEAAPVITDMAARGELEQVKIDGSKSSFYAMPGIDAPSNPIRARALLSPFDPLVWFRERCDWLFNFFYRIEIYTPVKRRQYGYYVLPFLLDEALAARVDLKADRANRTLRVPGAFLESGNDPDHVAPELANELIEMAAWLGMERIVIGRRGNFTQPLRAAIKAGSAMHEFHGLGI